LSIGTQQFAGQDECERFDRSEISRVVSRYEFGAIALTTART